MADVSGDHDAIFERFRSLDVRITSSFENLVNRIDDHFERLNGRVNTLEDKEHERELKEARQFGSLEASQRHRRRELAILGAAVTVLGPAFGALINWWTG